jgi:hypothetical protein
MHLFDLGVRCRWLISIMLWPLYPVESVSVPQVAEV